MPIKKLLIANRGEIAIRVMRAATELGIATVAVFAAEDKLSLHRFKADESYPIGKGLGPIQAYLDIDEILRVARMANCDAVHPGYGFLSESPEFAEACAADKIVFVGPPPDVMRSLGNKVSARRLAEEAGVPVMPATGPLPIEAQEIRGLAAEVGFPVMLKASWGGGGRGMRVIEDASGLLDQVDQGRREAVATFGNGEVYLEKLVLRARHVEVQLLGDTHGNLVHLFERDCSVQRRHQKVVERAPAPYLDEEQRAAISAAALGLARHAGYVNAGTVEFLMDADSGDFHFIEVNPRIQVEHTVTEQVTGIDIVRAQILVAQGARVGDAESSGVPAQEKIRLNGHALQCRVSTEDPENNFVPDYGRIAAYRGATGFGIRLDGGTAYSGAVITRHYDSLLEKVTAWGPTAEVAVLRMDRALREFRIRGVATNLVFLENVINHPAFRAGEVTTRFIDEAPELFAFPRRRDRATRLLRFIADVTVNGSPEAAGRPLPPANAHAPIVPSGFPAAVPDGARQLLDRLGPEAFAGWMLDEERVLVTDTTMRDAHQSLIATRMRSHDMVAVADAYARGLPQLLSLECWGGATFDVALRFLKEDPWDRLSDLRARVPNILLQMLVRGSNAVGYTNYPDNVVRHFIEQAAAAGVDLFRIFDALNWVENMKVAIEAVLETGKLCEASICYTGDLFDTRRDKYDLDYYVSLARQLKALGTHVLGLKDMAGVCRPEAARLLVHTLRQETGLPIHFHTHDTSGIGAASVLAAVEAGVDAIDVAVDSFSGFTSQPNLGSIARAISDTGRDTGLDAVTLRALSDYWEAVRVQYRAFESDLHAGASEVYLHEMPGGQFTNLKEQAASLGLAERWHEVASMYAEVNTLFGDIVKVTPTSKVVGDMALYMVSSGLTPEDVLNPEREIAFPESAIAMLRGDVGQPPGGWPEALSKKALKDAAPNTGRPGASMAEVDMRAARQAAEKVAGRHVSEVELVSHLMYPKVFEDYTDHRRAFGRVDVLSTPVFFYGMKPGQEIAVDIDAGKTLVIGLMAVGEPDETGEREVFFELNGQPRVIRVADRMVAPSVAAKERADPDDPSHVSAPMPAVIATLAVAEGQPVQAGDLVMTLEAMKMETAIHAPRSGKVVRLPVEAGQQVDAKDLLAVIE
ncbi:MAG TPA: pyruvate carboxylase [Rhodospirillales bacterium]|nr:pyruvate carboxylase [Rhodospirillales bacterium]